MGSTIVSSVVVNPGRRELLTPRDDSDGICPLWLCRVCVWLWEAGWLAIVGVLAGVASIAHGMAVDDNGIQAVLVFVGWVVPNCLSISVAVVVRGVIGLHVY